MVTEDIKFIPQNPHSKPKVFHGSYSTVNNGWETHPWDLPNPAYQARNILIVATETIVQDNAKDAELT